MQSAVASEKNAQKVAQSKKKKAARKTTKSSSLIPNGTNSLDAEKIVIESDGEKEDTEEVTLVMASEIEELGTLQRRKEVLEEPRIEGTSKTRLGESESNTIGREELTQSRLSPTLKGVNADEGSDELGAEETLPVPTTSETNVDDNHADSETEKQETEPVQSGTATKGRDPSGSKNKTEPEAGDGSEDQTEPEMAQSITTTRGRDLSESEDQTESDTRTKGGKRKRGRPPKNKNKLASNPSNSDRGNQASNPSNSDRGNQASNPSNSDRGNQDKDVRESVGGSDGDEPGASVESAESADELTSLNVAAKSVPTDSKSPTVSPRGTRKGKKSSDVSSAAAEVISTSPSRKRRKRGAEDVDEAKQDKGNETTGNTTATPGDDETQPKVGKSTLIIILLLSC